MKTILVTGSRLGIGQAITNQLLIAGYKIIGTSRQPELISIHHPRFRSVFLDLSMIVHDECALRLFVRDCGEIDGIVLNAGYGRFGCLEEFSMKQISELLTVNLEAQILLVRSFISAFKNQGSGDIIFIGSESALSGGRMGAVYSAAKFGLRGFSQALRHECASKNIRVGLVNPGMVSSSFFDDLCFQPAKDKENSILPQQVADAVTLILNSSINVVWDEINLSPLKNVVVKKVLNKPPEAIDSLRKN